MGITPAPGIGQSGGEGLGGAPGLAELRGHHAQQRATSAAGDAITGGVGGCQGPAQHRAGACEITGVNPRQTQRLQHSHPGRLATDGVFPAFAGVGSGDQLRQLCKDPGGLATVDEEPGPGRPAAASTRRPVAPTPPLPPVTRAKLRPGGRCGAAATR